VEHKELMTRHYRQLGGRFKAYLDPIKKTYTRWASVEIVTLV